MKSLQALYFFVTILFIYAICVTFLKHHTSEANISLISLNQSSVSLAPNGENWKLFFRNKESMYAERRRRIKAYCETQPNNFSRIYRNLLWHPKAGISMCIVNKIASTTYALHFGKLVNLKSNKKSDNNERIPRQNVLDEFPLPNNISSEELKKIWNTEDNISLVIYRNPLERLASIYHHFILYAKKFEVLLT